MVWMYRIPVPQKQREGNDRLHVPEAGKAVQYRKDLLLLAKPTFMPLDYNEIGTKIEV